jgi:serine/threonine-protein kinase
VPPAPDGLQHKKSDGTAPLSADPPAAARPSEPTADLPAARTPSLAASDYTQAYVPGKGDEPLPDLPSVPGYELLTILGRGGMGVVYKARQKGLNRLVALKMILAGGHAGAQQIARFRAEAEAVARLRHPNIVQIHEIGEADGHPFFCLEYVDGGTLATALHGMPQPADQSAALVRVLARAVEAAHHSNLVHRDLKPANILLQTDDHGGEKDEAFLPPLSSFVPKITDFGLAKQLDTDSGHTQSGSILGTPSYMAPEQAAGHAHAVGTAADVYALGAILYEMLTGRPPFRGASMLDTLEQVRSQEPVPPRQLLPKVPRDLETVCLKCLHKEPARRYASAAALADDLGHFLAGEPILARPVTAPERLWRWCKRNPWVAGLTAAVAFVFLAGLAISLYLNVRLEHEKAIAQANERIALEQADLALEAIGEMVFDIQQELADTLGAREAQLSIMRKATGELNRLVNMPATADKYLRRHALAHLQLGRLDWQTGDLPKAHREFELAVSFAEKAVASNPASDKAHYNRAATLMELGRSFEHQKQDLVVAKEKYKAAQEELAAMQSRLRDIPAGDPNLVEAERISLRDAEDLLAQIVDLLGRMHYSETDLKNRDLVAAKKFFQQSLDIRERLLAAKADHNIRSQLALSYTFLAEVAQFQDDQPEAATLHGKVVAQREAIYQERRSSMLARRALGGARLNYGDALCYNNQYDKALEQYRAALPLVEQVWVSEPDNLHSQNQLAQAHYCIGCIVITTDRKLGLKHFNEARKLREENYRVAVAKNAVTRMEANALMLTLAWCGEHERAAKMAEGLKANAIPKVLAEDLGATYGICRAAVGSDKTPEQLTSAERQLRQHYEELAMAAFRDAVARGYDSIYYLERDPDCQPMRGVPAFEQLLTEMRNAKK